MALCNKYKCIVTKKIAIKPDEVVKRKQGKISTDIFLKQKRVIKDNLCEK